LNNKVNLAVLVSGGGTNLQALIDAQKNGIITSGEIKLVVSSNKNAYALKRAENAGIKTAVCERKGFSQKEFEDNILNALEKEKIEVIVLAGFMSILSADFVKRYPDKIINVHPSLIPSFCGEGFYGLRVHKAALDYGVKVTGATVHFVNEIPDGGRIIMQKAVEIKENDTPEALQKRVMENAEWIILPAAAEKVCKEIKERKNERI
jgi:phosphoribosylglycinamide formyltransferase-1